MNSRPKVSPARLTRSRAVGFVLWAGLAGLTPVAHAAANANAALPSRPQAACPVLLQHRFERLQDEKPQSLCAYAGQVVLVVNTASFCGFTGQYAGLEALYARYRQQGLVVLGFPSNDFGRQEPGDNRAIADFCENTFGMKFPMFSKTGVAGREAHPFTDNWLCAPDSHRSGTFTST